MKQSRTDSFREAIINVSAGYIISVLVTLTIMALWGFEPTARDASEISLAFSAVSIIRTYFIRRLFNFRKKT